MQELKVLNLSQVNHGDVTDFERHVGDLGNVKADSHGVAHIHIFDPKGSLDPHSKVSVFFFIILLLGIVIKPLHCPKG